MCGLNKIVALNGLPTHAIVEDSLKHAAWNEDRGGYDEIDDVGLGAGIKYYTLPTPFIQRKINEGFFKTTDNATVNVQLTDRGYGIGRYFLSKDATDANNAKKIIADVARAQGLKILGWRNLSDSVNQTVLSEKANERMPAMWDAILIPDTDNQTEIFDLERAMLTTELHLENYTAENNNIDLSIISHSSHYWTFKGLIPAPQMGDYFPELQDPAFTATAADIHIRDPTAKDADAKKAHPFGKIAHNGEFNSADSNFAQLTAQHHENKRQGITSVLPKAGISDSMLMSLDLLDSLVTKKMNIYTALVQLMPPLTSTDYSDEINAMLKYQRLVRNPYNGPATVITEHNGYHIMATDTLSLRPAFYLIMEDKDRNRTFYSGSENLAPIPAGGKLIESGQLEAGGMIMITPTSEVLHTVDILNRISAQFNNQYGMTNYFQTQLQQHLLTLPQPDNIPEQQPINTAELRRKAFAAFMHREDEERILKMAAAGAETKGALGNDTNPLHEEDNHFSNSMHRKHAQVTAPALSPMLDPDSFHLIMYAGDNPISCPEWKRFGLPAALSTRELYAITQQSTINVYRLDTTFSLTQANNVDEAIAQLLSKLEILTQDSTKGGFLILSDETLSPDNIALPDLRVISEVRNYLACIGRLRDFPIISDSRQIATPHQAALQITFGAASVYPRTALEIINHHYQGDADEKNKQQEGCHHFIAGLNKEIAGDMGEIGVTDLGNYRFGNYASPLGINTKDDPHLSQLFGNSPLKGATREDLSNYTLARHEEAYKPNFNSNVLPRSGFLMPNPADDNKESIAHTFSHAVSGAMKHFFAEAGDDRNRLMVHYLLNYLGICEDYLSAEQLQDYTKERGYLDPNSRNADGFFNLEELEGFTPSVDFKKMTDIINKIRAEYPTTLYDRLQINKEKLAAFKEEYNKTASPDTPLQTLASILKCLSSGNMSYGALTKPAWLALLEGVKAGGMLGSAGEGGQPVSLIHTKNPLQIADIDQYAAGHFGVHIRSILRAKRIVVKVSQSAKPGSYAEVPGLKMDEEKAATRGCPEGTHVTSPTYLLSVASIEDLTPLYRLMKSINPAVEVDIKISTPADDISPTIRGASRKGYNFDLGSSSGGTGSAKLGSRNVGFPGIIGLLQTIAALRASGYAELVTVQVSDSFITALDILKIYILADLLNIRIEFGTTGMFTVGCEGDRTCYTDCSTGVAANEERFKGEAINASLYFLSLAADLQNWLCILGVKNLKDLSGHTELLSVIDPEFDQQYDLSSLINNKAPLKKVSPEKIAEIKKNRDTQIRSQTETDLMAVIEAELNKADAEGRPLNFTSDVIILTGKEHGFGAGIAGKFYFYLKDHPEAHITIKTKGIAGQFYGFGTPKGMSLIHRGHVQEKWCESLDGGDVTLIADDNSPNAKQPTLIAGGNLGLYGCNDGETHVVGDAGNNFRPLGKGGSVTIRGKVGDFACKYMTDGTAFLISRQIGRNLGQSIRGGIVFLYDPDGKNTRHLCHEIRVADAYETSAYSDTIRSMLIRHLDKTVTDPAEKSQYLQNFDFTKVKVLIPTALDQKKTLISILKLLSSYHLRKAPISPGVKVWLTQKVLQIIRPRHRGDITEDELTVLNRALDNSSLHPDTLPQEVYAQLKALRPVVSREPPVVDIEQVVAPQTVAKKAIPSAAVVEIKTARKKKHTASSLAEVNPVTERLSSIGALDKKMPPVVQNIFKIVALLKAEAERCKCLAQTCTTTTDKKTGCAEGKDIRTINDTLKKIGPVSANGILTKQQWALLREAAGLQFEKSFSPVTGHICDARCQQSDAGLDGGCTVATHDESVAIQKNEHLLGVIADDDDGLGWMTGRKTKSWTQDEFEALFGTGEQGAKNKKDYDDLMVEVGPIVKCCQDPAKTNKIVIIGGGPAGEAAAEKFAKNGYTNVHIYEASPRFGGLIDSGIPVHKGVNDIPRKNLSILRDVLGVTVHLNSEVIYDATTQAYYVKGDDKTPIATGNSDDTIILCTGTGKARALEDDITKELDEADKRKIIDGTRFLKTYNLIGNLISQIRKIFKEQRYDDIETFLTTQAYFRFDNHDKSIEEIKNMLAQYKDSWIPEDKENYLIEILTQKAFTSSLGVDPRGKQFNVIGLGDTAVDVIRSYAHLSKPGDQMYDATRGLTVYSRAPAPTEKKITDEIKRCQEEMVVTGATAEYLVVPHKITRNPETGKLSVTLKRSHYKCAHEIATFDTTNLSPDKLEKFEELKARFERLPRHKQIISKETYEPSTKDYDLIFVATGFTEASKTHPLMTSIPEQDRQNVYIAGDAAPGSTKTVVQAQASGHKTAADIMTKLEATASKKQATTAKKSSYFGKLSSALYTQQEAPHTRNTPAEAHAAEARRR